MTEQQEHNPEYSKQEFIIHPRHSFVDKYAVHPLLFGMLSLISIFLLYQVGGGILTFLVVGATTITRENVWTIRWLTLFGQITFILLPTLFFARLLSTSLRDVFPFRVPGIRESTFALIALLSLQRVFEAYMFFQKQIPMPQILREFVEPFKKVFEELVKILVRADSPLELLTVILVIAVVPSVVEELLFRGFVQRVFERLMSPIVSAILTGTIFGLFHINPFELIPLIGLGVFFGLLRYRSQSLWLPITAHFINNLMAVLASYYGLQDENLLAATQSEIGFSTMLFELIVFASVFFLSFVTYLRITHDVSRRIRMYE